MGKLEAACRNYEVLVEEKRVRNDEGVGVTIKRVRVLLNQNHEGLGPRSQKGGEDQKFALVEEGSLLVKCSSTFSSSTFRLFNRKAC